MIMRLRGFVAYLALALSSGCALVPKFEQPHLQVVDVDVVRADLLRQQLRVRMLVQNPNDRELNVRGITYEIQVAGEAFAHGESERDFRVPANGQMEFDVDATANAAATMLRLLGGGGRLDNIGYQITGTVKLANGLKRSVPFTHKGAIRLR